MRQNLDTFHRVIWPIIWNAARRHPSRSVAWVMDRVNLNLRKGGHAPISPRNARARRVVTLARQTSVNGSLTD